MSSRRILLIARNECSYIVRLVNYYLLVGIVLLTPLLSWKTRITWIRTGGGEGGLWPNSQFSVAYEVTLFGVVIYLLGLLDVVAKSWLRDREDAFTDLLLTTPLTRREYVWGKYLGLLTMTLLVVLLQLNVSILLQLAPRDSPDALGPLSVFNYLVPYVFFLLPSILFVLAVLLLLSVRLNSMAGVQLSGFVFFSCSVLLACWRPPWVPVWLRAALRVVDFTGFRWFYESFIQVDRGYRYYNQNPIAFDAEFLLNRAALFLMGLLLLEIAARFLGRESLEPTQRVSDPVPDLVPMSGGAAGSLALKVERRPVRAVSAFFSILRFELPALFLNRIFLVNLFIFALGGILVLFFQEGPFGGSLRMTSGLVVQSWFDVVMAYSVITVSFCLIESLFQDQTRRFSALVWTSPVPTGAWLAAKAASAVMFATTLLLVVIAGSILLQLTRGNTHPVMGPYLQVVGLLLPTLLFCAGLVSFFAAITGNRHGTYVLLMIFYLIIGTLKVTGSLTWVGNVFALGVWRWSDMVGLSGWSRPLLLNRALYMALSVPLFIAAGRIFKRADPDPILGGGIARSLFSTRDVLLGGAGLVTSLVIALYLYQDMAQGPDGSQMEQWVRTYYMKNAETYRQAPVPTMEAVDLDLTLRPRRRTLSARYRAYLRNNTKEPIWRIPVTLSPSITPTRWITEEGPLKPDLEDGLYVVRLTRALSPGDGYSLEIVYEASLNEHASQGPNLGVLPRFILPGGIYLNSLNTVDVFPVFGFLPLMEGLSPRRYYGPYWERRNESSFLPDPFIARIVARAPAGYVIVAPGERVSESRSPEIVEVCYTTDHPVRALPILAAPYEKSASGTSEVYFHPGHDQNVPMILKDLARSRELYSSWYGEYPFKSLRIVEFPGLGAFAEGLSSVIAYSESLGFVNARGDDSLSRMITVHEVAHQWWGMLVSPADGPSLPVLTESLAHFSALEYVQEEMGNSSRVKLSRHMERRYLALRSSGNEKPLAEHMGGTGRHDSVVQYEKGGFAFWMLAQTMGRKEFRAVLKEYVSRFRSNPDHPTLYDLLEMALVRCPIDRRLKTEDVIRQAFYQIVLPSYAIQDSRTEKLGRLYRTVINVTNLGSGSFPLEVAVQAGAGTESTIQLAEVRRVIPMRSGMTESITVESAFRPDRILLDPDAHILQANRQEEGSPVPGRD